MTDCFDYVVIGAGPAGCIAAGELKKMGNSVCVLERETENYRKVCGDGISFAAMNALKSIDFPIEYFEDAGAIRIDKFIFMIEDTKVYEQYLEEKGMLVYGLARNKTDAVFRRYLTDAAGVEIFYNHPVSAIMTVSADDSHPMYEVGGVKARKIVIAAGASARITLDGKPVISPDPANPAGVSAILRADNAKESYFLFNVKKEYLGTYGWLFCVGDGEYNAGLWLKEGKAHIKEAFNRFLDTRVKEYLGPDFEVVRHTRGVIMGIGEKRSHYSDSVFIIGDSANTSNPVDGEGVSRAILDALKLVNVLKDNNNRDE